VTGTDGTWDGDGDDSRPRKPQPKSFEVITDDAAECTEVRKAPRDDGNYYHCRGGHEEVSMKGMWLP
jgi:hypothetical protein